MGAFLLKQMEASGPESLKKEMRENAEEIINMVFEARDGNSDGFISRSEFEHDEL